MTLERMIHLMDRISQLANDQFDAGLSCGHPLSTRFEREAAAKERKEELEGIAEELGRMLSDARTEGQYDAGMTAKDMF